MATVLSAFSLCVLLCAVAVFSQPAYDLRSSKSSLSTDSVLKRVLKVDTVLSSNVEQLRASEQVSSVVEPSLLNLNPGDNLRRNKRQVITAQMCPDEMIRFMNRCMSFESYERLVKEEEAD